jgi:hypothetical protein
VVKPGGKKRYTGWDALLSVAPHATQLGRGLGRRMTTNGRFGRLSGIGERHVVSVPANACVRRAGPRPLCLILEARDVLTLRRFDSYHAV